MNIYFSIPESMVRKLAKLKGIKSYGKSIEEIVSALLEAGYNKELEHLRKQFAFTKNIGGFTIDKIKSRFPEAINSPEKFVRLLIERELIPPDALEKINWRIRYDDNIRICGILIDGQSVFINTVQRRTANRKNGWDEIIVDEYAYIVPFAIHFSSEAIEYRCSPGQLKKFEPFVKDLLLIQNEITKDRITHVTKSEAEEIKDMMKATYSSEQVDFPSSVGSIKFNSAKGTIDLANDQTLIEIKKKLKEINLPSDDTAYVVCHIEKFTDSVSGLEFSVTFEINVKTGEFKFLTKVVTQLVIDNIFEALIKVFLKRQSKMESKLV
ncbi:hypothetical protein PA598K_00173 [Paenibacillus sp. 598K]|uniref:hypothetical protein n=1 Tax=Paenibacillus sp. 598K TaxID=1117987 RepID=UPI000FFACAD9|nr:hypothetical protein [Paenibacillus sp. 598K]GBF71945.1 hypothetical protein PA598K_00173 [Paenibacillus sp. 598K]